MQNKKIKLAVLESKYYGTVTSVNDLVVRLDRDRFDVMFLYLDGRPESENHLEKAGYTVRDLSQNKLLSIIRPEVIYELYRVLKQNQIDLLHCHAHKAALYGAIAGKFLPQMKIIAHVHGLGRSARLRRKLSNFLFAGRIDRFLAVSQAVKQDLLDSNWRIPASKVTVLENSVDYERFAGAVAGRNSVRQMFGVPQDAFVFGFVGRFAPTKGVPYLLDAFAEVKKEFSNAYLLLAGQGPDEQRYSQQIQNLGLQKTVCFAGYQKEIEKFFGSLDVFVIPSVAEGMPRVLLEAMAAGIPCIGTSVGGIPDVIDGAVGFVVAPRSSKALAEAMKWMLQKNPDELFQMRTAAAQKARTRYAHAVLSEQLYAIYCDVLGIKD
ncbi:MAG TPA: glycosyltransferase [Anaerohalosphaeraceae bacterium]|nr:glycosyltransferase [Anaerohalosphaeraceae bacterium]